MVIFYHLQLLFLFHKQGNYARGDSVMSLQFKGLGFSSCLVHSRPHCFSEMEPAQQIRGSFGCGL